MKPPTLPEKPVDQFTVYWFTIYDSHIYEHKAVYHVNTKWDDYSPNSKGGANLVDDWMHYELSDETGRWHAQARWSGWDHCYTSTQNYWREMAYGTRVAALQAIQEQLQDKIETLGRQSQKASSRLAEIESEISRG